MSQEVLIEIKAIASDAIKQIKELKKSVDDTDKGFSDFQKSTISLNQGMQLLFGSSFSVMGAIGKIKDVMVDAIEAASKQEEAINELNVALMSAGSNSDAYSSGLAAFASELSSVTTYADETIGSAAALYIQLTKDVVGVKDATTAAANLASALNMDLNSAMMLLAKSAENGGSSLKRYGIEVQKGSSDAENLANAITAVNEKFAGVASSKINTYAGATKQASNAWGELLETLGEMVIKDPAVVSSIQSTTGALNALNAALQSPEQKAHTMDTFALGVAYKKVQDELAGLEDDYQRAIKTEAQYQTYVTGTIDKYRALQKEAEAYKKQIDANIRSEETVAKSKNAVSIQYYNEEQLLKKGYSDFVLQQDEIEQISARNKNNIAYQELVAGLGEQQAAEAIYKAEQLEAEAQHAQTQQEAQRLHEEAINTIKQASAEADKQRKQKAADDEKAQLVKTLDFKRLTHTQEVQAQKDTINNLSQLQNSGNQTMRSIGKAAALVQIGIKTAEGAISAYAAMAGIPYVGPALGVAAAAALVAYGAEQSAKVAGFQEGGIVPGTSYYGDRVTANVNSGEMILNQQQQAELFAMANGGNNAGSVNINVSISGDVVSDDTFIDKVVRGINEGVRIRNLQLRVA